MNYTIKFLISKSEVIFLNNQKVNMSKLLTIIFAIVTVLSFNFAHAGVKSDQEIRCLAEAIFYEAQAEKTKGKLFVGHTILNRVDHKEFPKTVCGVIAQKGQFQWFRNKALRGGRVFNQKSAQVEYFLAQNLYMSHLMNDRKDVTRGAIFFSSNGRRPAPRAQASVKIGRHQFYSLRELRRV